MPPIRPIGLRGMFFHVRGVVMLSVIVTVVLVLALVLVLISKKLKRDNNNYVMEFDYSLSIEDLIKKGNYKLNKENEEFVLRKYENNDSGQISRKATLFTCPDDLTPKDAIAFIEKQGLLPATIGELLAFCTEFPHVLSKSPAPILAPGSTKAKDIGFYGVMFVERGSSDNSPRIIGVANRWIDEEFKKGDWRLLGVSDELK